MEQFIESLRADAAFYLINVFAFFAVVVLTWLLVRANLLRQVYQLKTELAALRLGYNEQLFALEDVRRVKEEELRLVLSDLRSQLRVKNANLADARRNELSHLFFTDYREAVYQYSRLAIELHADDEQKRKQLLENHIFPFLQLSGDVLEVINQENLLKLVAAPKLILSERDLDFAFDVIRSVEQWNSFGLKRAKRQHTKRLGL